jgi:predicted kinase
MVIFMAGMPFAGKSYVVDKLVDNLPDEVLVITPKDYRPEEYDSMTEEQKKEINIAAWECTLELLKAKLKESNNNEIIIYDTSCASYLTMYDYFQTAHDCGHKVIYAFVKTSIEKCKERSKNTMSNEIMDKYKEKFKDSIKGLSKMSDRFIIINNDEEPDVSVILRVINEARVYKHK